MPTTPQRHNLALFTDEDMQHVKRTYVNSSKPGDRLIMRMIARIEASEECLKDYFEAGSVHPLLEAKWLSVKTKIK